MVAEDLVADEVALLVVGATGVRAGVQLGVGVVGDGLEDGAHPGGILAWKCIGCGELRCVGEFECLVLR